MPSYAEYIKLSWRTYKALLAKRQLKMAVKAVNDTTSSNGLVLILLVFGAYLRMHSIDLSAPTIIQRAAAIEKAIEQVRKIRAKNKMIYTLNTRNGPLVDLVHDLLLNFNILVLREGNAGRICNLTSPFKLLGIESEICKIRLPSGPTDF